MKDCCTVPIKKELTIFEDGVYAVPKGEMVYKILILSPTAQTVKIGTSAGSDDVMFEETLTPNVWHTNNKDVTPLGAASLVLFFSGFTGYAKIIIYKLKL